MPIIRNEYSEKAKGGTEAMVNKLETYLQAHNPAALDYYDIYPSRVRNFDPNRPSVLWLHDLPNDPESKILENGGEKNFDILVFVSDWQYQQYQQMFNLNGHNAVVINNGIDMMPVLRMSKFNNVGTEENPVRLIYHTTPHRGLEILVSAFYNLHKTLKDQGIHIVLDVYSSFKIYGWDERDKQFEHVFQACEDHEAITYHGTVTNSKIRKALDKSHVFAYPSIWPETSCIALMEAMSANVVCVHSNYGALADTAGGFTNMYPLIREGQDHMEKFQSYLQSVIMNLESEGTKSLLKLANERTRFLYDWPKLGNKWNSILSLNME